MTNKQNSKTKATIPMCVTALEEYVINELTYKQIEEKYNFAVGTAARNVGRGRNALWHAYKDCVQFPGPEQGYHDCYYIHEDERHHISGRPHIPGEEPGFFPGRGHAENYHVPAWPYDGEEMRQHKGEFAHVIALYRIDLKKAA